LRKLLTSKQKKDRSKAFHEAGHAVVARALGIAVNYVTISSTGPGNQGGAETHSAAWDAGNADLPAQLAAIEKDLNVSLAGPMAEHRHRPIKRINFDTGRPYWWAKDHPDPEPSSVEQPPVGNGTRSGLR
jgi:hypothetical protein